MKNESIGGSRFYVIFKDDATKFMHIFFMRHKAYIFEKLKEFDAIIQNRFGHSIKALRFDNGREYLNIFK